MVVEALLLLLLLLLLQVLLQVLLQLSPLLLLQQPQHAVDHLEVELLHAPAIYMQVEATLEAKELGALMLLVVAAGLMLLVVAAGLMMLVVDAMVMALVADKA